MVNLTIRLSKVGSNSGLKPEPSLLEADEASLPPRLVDGDLPVAKGTGFLFPGTCRINFVGVKAQRKPGDKVHICLMCDFPIAVYGRMDPCQHVLCFACAKSDSKCFLCKERVIRIQKVDVLVGLFICGVPGCLRSFLVRPEFELHVANDHSQNQQPESTKAGVSIGKATQSLGQSQIQSQHADLTNPARNSCANLQVIIPKKEDSQRSKDERTQKRRNGWESSRHGQGARENGKDQGHEGQNHRDRGGEYSYQSSRKRERERGAHPPNPFLSSSKLQPKPVTSLPPPPPYPPPNYAPGFPTLHEPNAGYPPRLERPREFFSVMAMPSRPEHLDTNVLLQHPGPLIGLQQGEWQALNLIPQSEGFGTNGIPRALPDGFGIPLRPMQPQPDGFNPQMAPQIRPHFLSDQFGNPIGMPTMTVPKGSVFHPHQQGPAPKRTMTFNGPRPTNGPSLGELIVDYGWGPGNLSNFAGGPAGSHVFTGWMPAANS
ncbi:hypothetical protein KC19_11G025400 [Ceratodon purpureus]|uniref:RING-type E3 ubiquitin transferase n=1 Tax=Ceratodon purpureus TaxID=3225 RepID=A0A8T0GFX7_CERPU|nr:hypothetical protein KC19_11G025400 [Ceratodon purpureus]